MNKLLFDEVPLVIQPSLAALIGLNEAIFIQQLHYWLRRSQHNGPEYDNRPWAFNTYEGWQDQFKFWSVSTTRRVINGLEKSGLVISTDKYNRRKADNTKWYTIDYDKLVKAPAQNEQAACQNRQAGDQSGQAPCSTWTEPLLNLNRALPENTQRLLTENVDDDERVRVYDFDTDDFGRVAETAQMLLGKPFLDSFDIQAINDWLGKDRMPVQRIIDGLQILYQHARNVGKKINTIRYFSAQLVQYNAAQEQIEQGRQQQWAAQEMKGIDGPANTPDVAPELSAEELAAAEELRRKMRTNNS
ncbi:hypothetical protein OS242_10355 [Tumebacillus sp. DT12]|uniref:DnaD domain-containing protein n=1 Tax=Tumebacillus lacus TaxID=2995335 RepID=A0ABT3X0D0_9BACL|nr:hypothetical protein [Tumebacillus lacus]MCX7570365.1 hypothetical protein [Tumebacillus lacus]